MTTFKLGKAGKQRLAKAARSVAYRVAEGQRFGHGAPFCEDGTPNCVLGHVLVFAGYKAALGRPTFVEFKGHTLDAYSIFHAAIDDHQQAHMQDVARIWRNNDRGQWEAVVAALNDFAEMIEQTL